jgi:hypothetical protein
MFLKRAVQFATLSAAFLCAVFALAGEQKIPEKYSHEEMRKLVLDSLQKSDGDIESMRDWVFSEVEEFIDDIYNVYRDGAISDTKDYAPNFRKEYAWFMRDGVFVRSPTLINGVAVSPVARTAAEEKWFKQEKKKGNQRKLLDYFFDFLEQYDDAIKKKPGPSLFTYSNRDIPFIWGDLPTEEKKSSKGTRFLRFNINPRLKSLGTLVAKV